MNEVILKGAFETAKDALKAKLANPATDPAWLVRAMLALFARQTDDEVRAEDTKHDNDRGFNSADARKLTGFAKQWTSREWLSERQLAVLRVKLPKYAGQLIRIARAKANAA